MPIKDQVKNYAKKWVADRPTERELKAIVRNKKPLAIHFHDDGIVPNNPNYPLLVYKGVINANSRFSGATLMDMLFETNGWTRSWRDTIYDFVHYHSRIHEVLGVARGTAKVEFGGVKGRVIAVKAGDVLVIPAGTGHRLLESSRNFLVVGAYPKDGTYDEVTDSRERPDAMKRIRKVARPREDPVHGADGPLLKTWKAKRKTR